MKPLICSILTPLLLSAGVFAAPPQFQSDETFSSYADRHNAWVQAQPADALVYPDLAKLLEEGFGGERLGRLEKETRERPSFVLGSARPWNEYWDDAPLVFGALSEELDQLSSIVGRAHMGAPIPLENLTGAGLGTPGGILSEHSIEWVSPLRRVTQYLTTHAVYLAFTGDTDGAIQRLQTAAGLHQHAMEIPVTTSWLIDLATRSLIADTMTEMVEYAPDLFGDAQLAAMQAILLEDLRADPAAMFRFNQLVTHEDWRLQFRSVEFARTNPELRESFDQVGGPTSFLRSLDQDPFIDLPDSRRGVPLAPLDRQIAVQSRMLDALLLDLAADPATQTMPEINRAIKKHLSGRNVDRFVPVYVDVFLWRMSLGLIHQYRYQATNKIVVLAIHRHRIRHGAWPDSLRELDPGTLPVAPVDLYSGQPLRYALVRDSPRLWGLGVDRDDDGGRRVRVKEGTWMSSGLTWLALDEWSQLSGERRQRYDGDLPILN